jgi:hypothetical protein
MRRCKGTSRQVFLSSIFVQVRGVGVEASCGSVRSVDQVASRAIGVLTLAFRWISYHLCPFGLSGVYLCRLIMSSFLPLPSPGLSSGCSIFLPLCRASSAAPFALLPVNVDQYECLSLFLRFMRGGHVRSSERV